MLENLGILAAFGAMLFWGIGDFYIQKTTRRLGDVEALFFIGLFGSIALLPFVFGNLSSVFSNSNLVLTLFFLGVSTLFVSIVNFQALKEGKLSVVEPILELELPVTIILAIIVFKEQLSLVQFLLSALMFLGIVLISVSKANIKSRQFLERGVLLAVATAVGTGFINLFTGSLARISSPVLAIWSAWTVFAIFCFLYLFHKKGVQKIVDDAKDFRNIVLAESFFDTAAWVLFAVSMVNLPISLSTAITESYPAIAVLLGILVNKEVVKAHQFAGMGLALTSSVALALLV